MRGDMTVRDFPDTRDSLLMRIQDPADHLAWMEFVAIYRPLVYRIARKKGMQDADAQDLAQKVLIAVAGKIGDWESDPDRGKFRSWLGQVARNAMIDAFRRNRPDAPAGGTQAVQALGDQPDSADAPWEQLEQEYRREVFRWAARRIRLEFAEATWLAFWRTTVEGMSVRDVSRQLEISEGAIYTARSRVMRRLKQEVAQHESTLEPGS